MQHYDTLQQEYPDNMTLRYNFDSLEDYLTTGEKIGAEGRIGEAISVLREAILRYPDSAAAQYDLGTALLLAVKEDRSHHELWESLSDDEDFLEQAIVAFQNAIDRDPVMLAAYNNLARALALHGRGDDALLVWERSLELESNQPDARADYEMFRTQLTGSAEEREARAVRLEDTGFDAPAVEEEGMDTQSDVIDSLPDQSGDETPPIR